MEARYKITQQSVGDLLGWIKNKTIAIPEIQRPFVWKPKDIRDFLDSLYKGYPVGYLISWSNSNTSLKDGSTSAKKLILIDGQQRVTALMVALLGQTVLDEKYKPKQIRISFNPESKKFQVRNSATSKNKIWIDDITKIFKQPLSKLCKDYVQQNHGTNYETTQYEATLKILEEVRNIKNNPVGLIELKDDLDIMTVTEIFKRVNSMGSKLSQSDFVMSKIAVNENYGGNMLRRAIDHFCHLVVAPEEFSTVEKDDTTFVTSEFWPKMKWLKSIKSNDNLYDPTYSDMIRVAFTSEFKRSKFQDLVALLSGRNFDTRGYDDAIVKDSFAKLKKGICNFMNKAHFNEFTMILRSAGFVTKNLITAKTAINFAYILYLRGRDEELDRDDLERVVRSWYIMSILSRRYSRSANTVFEEDIHQMKRQGLVKYAEDTIKEKLSDAFWNRTLPHAMNISSATNSYFLLYQAAQVNLGDKGFLSKDITVGAMLLGKGDKHHIFPRNHLKKKGFLPRDYNQIANFALTQTKINLDIGDKAPKDYFTEITDQVNGGPKHYGGIVDQKRLRENFHQNCIPESMVDGDVPEYANFLNQRRELMAQRIRKWFEVLS